jgi:hypothetical protein
MNKKPKKPVTKSKPVKKATSVKETKVAKATLRNIKKVASKKVEPVIKPVSGPARDVAPVNPPQSVDISQNATALIGQGIMMSQYSFGG